eukprot:1869537-Amphidinium_carterae.1
MSARLVTLLQDRTNQKHAATVLESSADESASMATNTDPQECQKKNQRHDFHTLPRLPLVKSCVMLSILSNL